VFSLAAIIVLAVFVLYALGSEVWADGVTVEADDAGGDDVIVDVFREQALGEWVEVADGSAEIRAHLPEGWDGRTGRVRLRLTAAFGPLSHEWRQGPYRIEPGEEVQIPVEVPEEAWLDDLSETYVTILRVHADVGGADGVLPDAVIAWPEGHREGPVVWTEARARTEAPFGVFDASLHALAADLGLGSDERFEPPIDTPARLRRGDTGDFEPVTTRGTE
jgi:hypothetical protein